MVDDPMADGAKRPMEDRDLLHLHEQVTPSMPRNFFIIEAAEVRSQGENRPKPWSMADWDLLRDHFCSADRGGQRRSRRRSVFNIQEELLRENGSHTLLKAGTGWGKSTLVPPLSKESPLA
eukprot:2418190-Amphidinium_carterae.1